MPKYTTDSSQLAFQFDEIPYGYCRCGCGQKTNIATMSNTAHGVIKGEPFRFIRLHHTRNPNPGEGPNPSGLCMCGCGQKAPIAKDANRRLSHVAGKPVKFIRGHCSHVQVRPSVEERFWSYVDKRGANECWEWQGAINAGGYGILSIDKKCVTTHRLSYEITNGSIPDSLFVCHSCDNRPCCNPAHLWIGTRNDNIQDMKQKGRAKSGGLYGEAMPQSKITEAIAREIMRLYDSGEFTQKQICQKIGVSRGIVSDIVRGISWKQAFHHV